MLCKQTFAQEVRGQLPQMHPEATAAPLAEEARAVAAAAVLVPEEVQVEDTAQEVAPSYRTAMPHGATKVL